MYKLLLEEVTKYRGKYDFLKSMQNKQIDVVEFVSPEDLREKINNFAKNNLYIFDILSTTSEEGEPGFTIIMSAYPMTKS